MLSRSEVAQGNKIRNAGRQESRNTDAGSGGGIARSFPGFVHSCLPQNHRPRQTRRSPVHFRSVFRDLRKTKSLNRRGRRARQRPWEFRTVGASESWWPSLPRADAPWAIESRPDWGLGSAALPRYTLTVIGVTWHLTEFPGRHRARGQCTIITAPRTNTRLQSRGSAASKNKSASRRTGCGRQCIVSTSGLYACNTGTPICRRLLTQSAGQNESG